jgi:hypothetical protein
MAYAVSREGYIVVCQNGVSTKADILFFLVTPGSRYKKNGFPGYFKEERGVKNYFIDFGGMYFTIGRGIYF